MRTSSNPIHILLADDDDDDRLLFTEAITNSSISAFLMTVADGAELMNLLSTLPAAPPPHVIFLDINMPRKNGIECLQEIRSNRRFDNVPVFMFSTSESKNVIDQTFNYGANLYIPKLLFFANENAILEKLFSRHWKEYVLNKRKENYLLKMDMLKR